MYINDYTAFMNVSIGRIHLSRRIDSAREVHKAQLLCRDKFHGYHMKTRNPKICCIVCISRLSTDCLAPELQCSETVNERKLFIYRKQFIFSRVLCI